VFSNGLFYFKVTSASFVAKMMSHYRNWHVVHPASLTHYYHILSLLLHQATCLLIQPLSVGRLLSPAAAAATSEAGEDSAVLERRVRHSSTSASSEFEMESTFSTTWAQSALLESCASVLVALQALSPSLADLIAGELRFRPDEWHQLLAIGFSSPSFEHEVWFHDTTVYHRCIV